MPDEDRVRLRSRWEPVAAKDSPPLGGKSKQRPAQPAHCFIPQIAKLQGFLLLNGWVPDSGNWLPLPLPPCFPSLSPFMISLLAALLPCLPSLSPFMISLLATAAALSPKLVSLHDFAFGCAAALSVKLVLFHDFAFGYRCRLVSQACLPS